MNSTQISHIAVGVLISVFILSSSRIQAQTGSVQGTIYDENKEFINYANIILLTQDSVFVDGGLTDEQGGYFIRANQGEYILQVRALGFKNIFQNIKISNQLIDQDIYMQNNDIRLKEIVVNSKTPFVKREADRLIFDASNIAKGSNDVLDILKNVPGLVVTNDDIKILGQEGLKILINEKEQKISGRDLFALLKSLQAEQIDKIEIITAPPSKFDAEGSAGILNIKLKKAKVDYISTVLNYAYSYDKYHMNEFNANFIYNKNQINASFNANGAIGKTQYEEKNREEYIGFNRGNISKALNKSKVYNLRGNIDYQLNKDITIGILAVYSNQNNKNNLSGESTFYPISQSDPDSILLSKNPYINDVYTYRTNVYSNIKIDSLGKNIYFDIDLLGSRYNSKRLFTSKTYNSEMSYIGGDYHFNNDNKRKIESVSSSLDFVLPFKNYTLNVGAKISLTETRNEIYYYNQSSLEDQDNNFSYKENIYALYADFSKKINKKITLKSGLRLEHTYTKGQNMDLISNDTQQEYTKNNYTRIFPSLYLGYKLNLEHQFNLSFSSRISRPSFRNINPFVLYTNKYSTVSGNPDLKPSYTYKLNLGYTLKGYFNLDAYYSFQDDVYTQIQKTDTLNRTINTFWDNALRTNTVGVNNSYFFNKYNWMQVFFIHGINYEKSYSNSKYTLSRRNNFQYIASLNASFYFNKKKTITSWFNISYSSAERLATTDLKNTYNLNLGAQYGLLENKLKFLLSFNNIISSNIKGNVNSNDFKMYFNNKYNYPTIKLAVVYILGAKLTSKKYRNSDTQDRME